MTRKCLALLAITGSLAIGGDWLTLGGDPQNSGWQRRGLRVTPATAHEMKLIWKFQPPASGKLTAPLILGASITHRGIRELAFVASADTLYAIDADFGKLFWTRHFERTVRAALCATGRMATPVIQPNPRIDYFGPGIPDAQDTDDEPTHMRPLHVLSTDGRLYTVRASDGADNNPPIDFLYPDASATNLNIVGTSVYTTVTQPCGGTEEGVWGLDLKTQKKQSYPVERVENGVAAGSDGTVYFSTGAKVQSPSHSFTAPADLTLTPVVFKWQAREFVMTGTRTNIVLLNAASLTTAGTHADAKADFSGRIATWPDPSGTRWIYAIAGDRIQAFKLTGTAAQPHVERVWTSKNIPKPSSPAVVHGVLYTLSGTTLYAFDSATGQQLYASTESIPAGVHSEIAVANGHVCFTASDSVLYCFGIPIER